MSTTNADPCLMHFLIPGTRPSVGKNLSTCISSTAAATAAITASSPTAVGAEASEPLATKIATSGEFSRLPCTTTTSNAPTLSFTSSGASGVGADTNTDANASVAYSVTTATARMGKPLPSLSLNFPSSTPTYTPSSPPASPMKPASRLSTALATASSQVSLSDPTLGHLVVQQRQQQQQQQQQQQHLAMDPDAQILASARTLLQQELKTGTSSKNDPMHATYLRLALRALDTLAASPNWRITIVVAGIPGSGKSTLAAAVAEILNKAYTAALESNSSSSSSLSPPSSSSTTTSALILPSTPRKSFSLPSGASTDNNKNHTGSVGFAATVTMDGYHLTRAQLDKFPNPAEAHARRGSPWTFDAQGVVDMARTLRASCVSRFTNTDEYCEDYFSCPRQSLSSQTLLPIDIVGLSPPARMLSSMSSSSSTSMSPSLLSSYKDLSHHTNINNNPVIINKTPDNASSQCCHNPSAVPSTMVTVLPASASDSITNLTLPATPGRDDEGDHGVSNAHVHKILDQQQQELPPTLYFPSFDHAVKDPTPNGIMVQSNARIVMLEGLYLLYNEAPWRDIAATADDSWMLDVTVDVATSRLAARHLDAGIVTSLEQGLERVRTNDELNARLIQANTVEPQLWVQSVPYSV
ncbi:uncharacterized protein SAPINGB_P003876 [Magnusiomyces paraingens]|uniref:Phosphoribulokinase/uridine kinase domain-containing protein n=1 Tax=Magnusiomyces paraingens TaxID=2606893 RepID=A0A5E8BTU1_9ASCO|nr:uncharacterized protein SAPINGB_P003876 [Saprochaete ingens]VVT54039.1 unnamed protein product [Saprochaete ingens]